MDLLISFFLTTGMVVTFLILFALFRKQGKELPRQILIVIFVLLFGISFSAYGEWHNIRLMHALGFLCADPIGFLLGPLLLLYINSLYKAPEGLVRRYLWHFLPFLAYALFVTLPFAVGILWGNYPFVYLETIDQFEVFLQLQGIYLIGYCLFALRVLGKYQELIKDNYSSFQKKDLSWVRYLLLAILATILLNLGLVILELFIGEQNWGIEFITTAAMIGMIVYLGYFGTSQSRILLPAHLAPETSPNPLVPESVSPVHHLSTASEADIQELRIRLEEVLKTQQPYLEEDLTLGALADLLPTTDKKLSALLNHFLHVSFYDLINEYRVKAVQAKMADSEFEHYTLLAIAFDCGFSSKTSFNRIFKKVTGVSPSLYKKQLQNSPDK